ncbi:MULTISPECIES: hypothetical protein [unclassified Streptomyces]|uniref:hypothetical protein n=1 Tax=unclassified Streptomyces TaxID=2593676 RepID=UPI0004B784D3|nr:MULTISPECIES: hypothetical protein [unclassified Streptomyces]MYY17424.1 hypothetical protein [Streptomyces sp. SID4912]SCE34179.1 hypothetical protein GA0115241_1133217 [Streptomyces sp. DpondAA-D4]
MAPPTGEGRYVPLARGPVCPPRTVLGRHTARLSRPSWARAGSRASAAPVEAAFLPRAGLGRDAETGIERQ